MDVEIENKKPPVNTVGDSLESVIKHVGEMGTYQRLLFVAMLPFGVTWAFIYFGQMFLTATPSEHWCLVPQLANLTMELRRNLSIPLLPNGEDYDHCNMYFADYDLVLETMAPPDPGTPIVPCQHGWEFLLEDIPYETVVSEREWVCDKADLVPWSQTIAFAGSIVGGIVIGSLADVFGRVPMFIVANLLAVIGGVSCIFTTGFWDFSICRFLVGMSCDSSFLLMYILVLEYVGISHRTWVANLSICLYFGSGCVILPWIALAIGNWKILSLAITLPMLCAVLAPCLVPESMRWYISKGRVDKAVDILRRFERINKTKIPEPVINEFIMTAKNFNEENREFLKQPAFWYILSILIGSFMSIALLFDGLIRLSETLGLDFFVTFTITSATEVPSVIGLLLFLDRYGRRKLVFVTMILSALLTLITAFIPRGVGSVALATTARFLVNMAYGAIIQWTPELMPTAVRASAASAVHVSAFCAVVVSPFMVYSERVWLGLPLIIMTAVAVVGGSVALLLPETTGRAMPQTADDWQELADTRPYRRYFQRPNRRSLKAAQSTSCS